MTCKFQKALDTYNHASQSLTEAARLLGIPRSTVWSRIKKARKMGLQSFLEDGPQDEGENRSSITQSGDKQVFLFEGYTIKTVEELLDDSGVDLSIWEIHQTEITNWEVGGKKRDDQVIKTAVSKDTPKSNTTTKSNKEEEIYSRPTTHHYIYSNRECKEVVVRKDTLWKMPLRRVKVVLRKKENTLVAIQRILEDIGNKSLVVPKKVWKPSKKKRIALEISIMDPHMGLLCDIPMSDHKWDLELCRDYFMFLTAEIIQESQKLGDLEKIYWVFGNDFNHVDNLHRTTTKGTPQPESSYTQQALYEGYKLAIAAAEEMLKVAPVEAFQIPGNHDTLLSNCQGLLLEAHFRNDPNFTIDYSPTTYKKIRYGATLIGLEHGHNIKSAVRLGLLMANEWRQDWSETHFHEWHLGDQHRKGTMKPSSFEEQGVSIEYLPGLVAPNEWHRSKSFNFQKRGGTGFILDYDCGITHRLSCNISKYTGRFLGTSYDKWKASR